MRRTSYHGRRPAGHSHRLGGHLSRPQRRALHRPARPLRQDPGRLRPRKRRPDAATGQDAAAGVCRPCDGRCGRLVRRGRSIRSWSPGRSRSVCKHLEILNRSATPPFQPTSKELPGEDLRLKYRYIDLRRPEMQQTLVLRHRMIKMMRDYFDEQGFIDVETPMLGPEHARGRPRLPRPQPHSARLVFCPAAVAAALQADFDDCRLRPLRPGGAVFPRRGPSRGPSARVHPVGRGNVVHHGRGHHRRDRRTGGAIGEGDFGVGVDAPLAADVLRRGDGAVRPRRARPAIRHGAGRSDRPGRGRANSAFSAIRRPRASASAASTPRGRPTAIPARESTS